MTEPICAATSAAFDEEVRGTASIVRSWLLIEQPGPWGHDAIVESRFPAPLGRRIEARARRHGVRVLLIRKPDRATTEGRRCYVAYSGRPSPWVEARILDDPRELLDIDFAALRAARSPNFGDPFDDPLYLVCTHGRHDPCCAQFGRPVVRELLSRRPDEVWECTHIGGERFAGNLLILPHGLYFGRLDPPGATRAVEHYERGAIDLDNFRGRAGDPFVVQAAEDFLRRAEGLLGVDDVVPGPPRGRVPGVVEVDFTGPGGTRYGVRVGVSPALVPRPVTCTAPEPGRPPTYTLVDLMTQDPSGPAVH